MSTGATRRRRTTVADLRRRRLLGMLVSETAAVRDMADLIRADAELARVVLHSANAGLPDDRAPVRRLDEAIVLLGLKRLWTLIEGVHTSA